MRNKNYVFNRSRKRKVWLCLFVALLIPAFAGNPTFAGNTSSPLPSVNQQKKSISGVVVDAEGEPIIGAVVAEKGTTNGTLTDSDGKFTCSVDESSVLEISSLGFVSKTMEVKNITSDLQIVLVANTKILDEIVVTGFGLTQKKASVTGAISTIGSKDIERSSSSTVSGALVGKIAGLNTRQTDGRPGSGVEMSIRNMGTPLFVIDGIQVEQPQFNNLNFNDIDNISILKDASASIYGVRAANGVVVVTTKKGKRNTKNTVSLNGYYGVQENFKFAQPADAKLYVTKYVQSETMKIAQGRMKEDQRLYSREEYDKWMAGTERGYQSFDWLDYIWGSAPQTYVNVNVTGGSDKTNYYVSVAHLDQQSTIKQYGGFKRTNVQMNLDTDITSRLKVGFGVNGRLEGKENPGVPGGDDTWLPRFAPFRNVPTMGPYANGNPDYPQLLDDAQTNFAILNYDQSGRLTEDWRVMQLNGNAEFAITKDLKARTLVSYLFASRLFNNHEYTYSLYRYDKANDEYKTAYTMNTPYRERVHEEAREITSNTQLAYDKKIGLHSIAAVLGLETIKRSTPHTRLVSTPISNMVEEIYLGEVKELSQELDNTSARMGYVSRINYNYAEKYLLELSGRYDGSWKFMPGKRWGFFPSASVGWRISEEKFWKESKISSILNYVKLRTSYGLVGNDDLGDNLKPYAFLAGSSYNDGGASIDGSYVVGSKPRALPTHSVSWMEAKIFDVGFEAAVLDSRLRTEFSFFNRLQTGIPEIRWDAVMPSEVGFIAPRENLNSNVNRGVDGMVTWSDKINDLSYNFGLNATYARFYDWEQNNDRQGNSLEQYRKSIVKRFGYQNWGLEAIGQFQSWDEIANYTIDNDRQGNRTVIPGDIKYKDINGDGVINDMDERPIGYRQDATPVFNYGVSMGAAWKGFDLAIDFSGTFFNTYFQQWEQARAFQNNANSPEFLFKDSWSLSDIWDANSALIPGKYPMALKDRDGDNTYWNSSFWKHDVKYLKLRNLEFGYTLPKKLIAKAGISHVRLYFSGTNLFSISNVPSVDPEQKDDNGLGYPTMRVMNFGINLKF